MALNALCLAGQLIADFVPVAIGGHVLLRGLLEHRQRPRIASRAQECVREQPLTIEYEAWDGIARRAFGLMKRGKAVVVHGTLSQRRLETEQGITTQLYMRVVMIDALPPAGEPLHLAGMPLDQEDGPGQRGRSGSQCARCDPESTPRAGGPTQALRRARKSAAQGHGAARSRAHQ